MSTSSSATSRRNFLRGAAAAAVGAVSVGAFPRSVLGANDRIGIGFIGCGGRAGGHLDMVRYLRDEAKMPVDIVAVCDVYRPRMQKAAAHKPKMYMDHRELLADPNVNIVCIATPDHHHAYQAIDAVKAGKDVYCEKPVTHWRQFDLLKKLAEEVKKSGRAFQAGTQGMSDSCFSQARKLIQDGLIGQPIHAECGYFRVGDWGERGMPIDDANAKPGTDLNWDAFLGDSPKRPFDVSRFFRWRMYEDYAGGPVTDLYPHSLTPVLAMLQPGFPSKVVAVGGMYRYTEREVPDTCNMMIEYPQKLAIMLMGTQGNNYGGTGDRGAGGRSPIVRGWDGAIHFQGGEIIFTPAEGSNKKAQRFKIERGENNIDHWINLIECAKAGKQDTWSPAPLALHVQTALIMGALAQRQGKVATFNAEKQEIVL